MTCILKFPFLKTQRDLQKMGQKYCKSQRGVWKNQGNEIFCFGEFYNTWHKLKSPEKTGNNSENVSIRSGSRQAGRVFS